MRKILIGLLICMLGCAEKEVIIPPLEIPTTGRTVLVEDLTGVRCPNCPSGNARLESVQSIYGKNVVVVSVHGEFLTDPLPESEADLRSPSAILLEEFWRPFLGKPSAVIDRKSYDGFFSMVPNPLQDQWQPIIERELQEPHMADLVVDATLDNQGILVSTGIIAIEELQDISIHIFLVENSIVDPQEDVDKLILDYEHNHVLRYIPTPIEGDPIAENIEIGDISNYTMTIDIAELREEWNIENMEIVCFITGEEGGVIQVQTASILQ